MAGGRLGLGDVELLRRQQKQQHKMALTLQLTKK